MAFPGTGRHISKYVHTRLMKTHKTISIDIEVALLLEERPNGFLSQVCNEALRVALEIPEPENKKKNPDKLYVPGIGWVKK